MLHKPQTPRVEHTTAGSPQPHTVAACGALPINHNLLNTLCCLLVCCVRSAACTMHFAHHKSSSAYARGMVKCTWLLLVVLLAKTLRHTHSRRVMQTRPIAICAAHFAACWYATCIALPTQCFVQITRDILHMHEVW
jgi:hypothetical protein